MWQKIIVAAIVASTLILAVRRAVRTAKGRGSCSCGCQGCPRTGKKECHCGHVKLPEVDSE